jgi:hypothetical protein
MGWKKLLFASVLSCGLHPLAVMGATDPAVQGCASVPACAAAGAAAGAAAAAGTAPTGGAAQARAAAVPAPAAAPVAACPSEEDWQKVTVSSVFIPPSAQALDPSKAASPLPSDAIPTVELRDAIGVKVEHLDVLLQKEACTHSKVVLFLDRRPLTDLKPYPRSAPAGNILYFQLQRTEASREVWTYLLGRPGFKPRKVQIGVGFEDGYALPWTSGNAPYMLLRVIPRQWLFVWSILFLGLLVGLAALGARSDMLRETGALPGGARKAYSLGRVQLATWTVLVLGGYLFIGLITGDYTSSITDSVLGLLGISVGTAIGASIIDLSPSRSAAAPLVVPPDQPVAPPARLPAATSGKWWLDILSDSNGVNFHRFQIAAWTVVLGTVFIQQVFRDLAMPEFGTNLLALMGISSGTYLGLKITAE